jgi:PAS domain-containing protein
MRPGETARGMTQKAVELILMRQLASYLAVPTFLVDPEGNLLYYNEPAERLLGRRYDETGEMPLAEWSTAFTPTAEDGTPLPPEHLPLTIALRARQPAHRTMRISGLDGVQRRIEVTAFPLEAQGGRHLGAVAIFWEQPSG